MAGPDRSSELNIAVHSSPSRFIRIRTSVADMPLSAFPGLSARTALRPQAGRPPSGGGSAGPTPPPLALSVPQSPNAPAVYRTVASPAGLTRTCWRTCSAGSGSAPEKMRLRKQLVEHPFGTIKRAWNQGYFLTRGLDSVNAEMNLTVLAYRSSSLTGQPQKGHSHPWPPQNGRSPGLTRASTILPPLWLISRPDHRPNHLYRINPLSSACPFSTVW